MVRVLSAANTGTDFMANDGTDYEALVEGIVQIICEVHGVDTLHLEQRRTVQGRTTSHEMDVWWHFRGGSGVERHLWFSCKDWASPIKGEQLWEFKARLDDLDPRPHGVFVTKSRYQKGAHQVAAANGITIFELRQPTEKDWKGRLKTLEIDLTAYIPGMRNVRISITDGAEGRFGGMNEDFLVIEPDRPPVSLRELQGHLAYEGNEWEAADWHEVTRTFPEGTQLEGPGVGRAGLRSITAEVRVATRTDTVIIDGDTLVKYIVRDAATGRASWLGEDLVIRGGELDEDLGLL